MNITKPLLTIIIPTFNSATTIEATLLSVINQTYKNIEVLVLDGVSSDATCQLVKNYIKTNPFIKLITEKDKGVYDAMNKGIALSKGDFLYFMGSDDVFYSNNTLETIFTNKNNTFDIIYGNVQLKNSKRTHSGESSLKKLTYSQISICHQSIFYSKKTFDLVGNYNLKYFIHADYDFNIRCFQHKAIKIKYLDIVVAIFNETGLSGTKSNADGFHTELTQLYLAQNYNIVDLYNEKLALQLRIENIINSKEYQLGKLILKPLKKVKNIFFK